MRSLPAPGEFLRLVRFEHALMLALAVFLAEIITLGRLPPLTSLILLSLLVPIFSEMGSFALNDYLDLESDRINKKRDRPLVRGTVSPTFAYRFSLFAFLVSTLAAFLIHLPALLIALVFNILAIAYNFKLKDLPLIGNVYIAFTMAIPFIFGNLVVSSAFHPTALVLVALAFLAGLAREIVKTVQDFEGDKKARKANTLPAVIGKTNSLRAAAVLYLLFVPLTALPFYAGLAPHLLSVILIALADIGIIYIVYSILHSPSKNAFQLARNISLAALFVGLVGYLVASV